MGYLDNSSITVDAVLTKKGREVLEKGGNLNITSFTLSDTGVDYTLWNPSHPSGSAYYGEAIENLPMLEATPHAHFNLRNRLLSLNQSSVAVPALILGGLDTKNGTQITFKEGDENKGRINVDLVGYSNSKMTANTNGYEFYFVIEDPTVVSTNAIDIGGLAGTGGEMFLQSQNIPHARRYGFNGNSFVLKPIQQDLTNRQTHVHVTHVGTGVFNSFTVINDIVKNPTSLMSGYIKQ